MAEKKNLTTKITLQNLTTALKNTFVKKTAFNTLSGTVDDINDKVATLIGTEKDSEDAAKLLDAGKSVRKIANEELAKQLIADGADTKLDELKEIADWIQQHPKDAAAMNSAITALTEKLTLGNAVEAGYVKATGTYVEGTKYYEDAEGTTEKTGLSEGDDVSDYYVGQAAQEYATVKAYVEAAISKALEVGAYATAAALEAAVARIEALEGKVETLEGSVLYQDDIVDFSVDEIEKMLADVSFTLSDTAGTVAKDATTTFTATVASTTTLAVSSANEDVATVTPSTEADGDNTVYTFTVTGVAAGTTTITVKNAANQYDANDFAITVTE